MNSGSWDWLIERAREQSVKAGEKRYIIGQPRHYQGWHGWAYCVVRPDEYVRHRAQRPRS